MVLITIVTGAYKPTYNWGASHCIIVYINRRCYLLMNKKTYQCVHFPAPIFLQGIFAFPTISRESCCKSLRHIAQRLLPRDLFLCDKPKTFGQGNLSLLSEDAGKGLEDQCLRFQYEGFLEWGYPQMDGL